MGWHHGEKIVEDYKLGDIVVLLFSQFVIFGLPDLVAFSPEHLLLFLTRRTEVVSDASSSSFSRRNLSKSLGSGGVGGSCSKRSCDGKTTFHSWVNV